MNSDEQAALSAVADFLAGYSKRDLEACVSAIASVPFSSGTYSFTQ